MSRAGSQERTLLAILAELRPHWRRDPGLHLRLEKLLRADRRLGSRDRRLYRELCYTALRYLPWIEPLLDAQPAEAVRRLAWLAAPTAAVRPFRDERAGGSPPCPDGADAKAALLGESADALSPGWLASECPEALKPPLRDVLLTRAPLWVRLLGPDGTEALAEFSALGWEWSGSPGVAGAVRLPTDADVARTKAYQAGRVEIQDAGSQRILASAGIAPGGHWLDACAGAGGKTLQLAAILGAGGRVTARDPRTEALAELRERVARSRPAAAVSTGPAADPVGGYDGVLVDAPCTGSGTWRRSPHLRWTTRPERIGDAAALQLRLLRENTARVRPGGLLLYATCSLCRSENEAVVAKLLETERNLEPVLPGERLRPDAHDGDGFFLARFRRR